MPGSTDANFSDNFSDLSYTKPRRRCPNWLYNNRTKEFLGRTKSSWFLIVTFYLVLYAFLAAFFMGMMLTFMYTIVPTDIPLRSGQHSLLKLTPGIGMRPSVDAAKTLIKLTVKDSHTYQPYVQNLNTFLKPYYDLVYKAKSYPENIATCENGKKEPNSVEKICVFDLKLLGPCTMENKYGYSDGKPCIILKLNKIYGWLPSISKNSTAQHPLVSCKGQNPLDNENIGIMKYYPGENFNGSNYGKFDNSFYPYIGQASYVSPLVAIQFESLKPNVPVLIECDVYNIDTFTTTDIVRFEMLID